MPLILDPKQADKLRMKKRVKRMLISKPGIKAERELLKRMSALWRKVLFPATERIKQIIEAGGTPGQIADVIEKALDQAEFEYGFATGDIVWRWRLSLDADTRRNFLGGLKHSLGVDIQAMLDEQPVADVLAIGGWEAANLIKTIPGEYLGQVARAVADNFSGRPLPDGRSLLQQIQHIGDVTDVLDLLQ